VDFENFDRSAGRSVIKNADYKFDQYTTQDAPPTESHI
jgi:hypothetical protein